VTAPATHTPIRTRPKRLRFTFFSIPLSGCRKSDF